MQRKDAIDSFGAISLIGFSAILGFNQVVIKVVNAGIQPVLAAGLRSVIAMCLLYAWMRWRGRWTGLPRGSRRDAIAVGVLFAAEFILLYQSLDLTSVARASVIFYSMPVWMVLGAHLWIPGEGLSARKLAGLVLALIGVGWALLDRDAGGQASVAGDLMALGAALCWAGIGLFARISSFSRLEPVNQLFWQVAVSAVILMPLALLFGPLIRDLAPIHLWGLGFQAVGVVTLGYLFWFWLLKRYPAGAVASFGFLSPVFGVLCGWALLGERIGMTILGALVLVAAGIYLINSGGRQVPQKVA